MIPISFLSAIAYLLDDAPTWNESVEIAAELPTQSNRGKTARETRVPKGDTLRLSVSWRALVRGAAVSSLRNSLQALTTHKVLCPLWPAWFEAGDTPPVTASYYVLMGDGYTPEIKTHAELPFARDAYPLLVGRLNDAPDASLLTGEIEFATFDFSENDSLYVTPPAFSCPNALEDGSGAIRPLLAFRPNWATSPRQRVEREIEREDIGQGRVSAESYHDQPTIRDAALSFTLTRSEPWQLLRVFLDMYGPVKTMWVPASLSEGRLIGSVGGSDEAIEVTDVTVRGNNAHLLLDDLTNRAAIKVVANDSSVWVLDGEVGSSFEAAHTRIESLMLARFKSNRLTLRFTTPELAQTQIAFVETPWETDASSGETIGGTIGALAPKAYLYHFTIAYPGATEHFRYTGFERDLSYGGNTFTAQYFEHAEIRETASLDRIETTLKSRMFTGNPLSLLLPFYLEWPLMLDIYEVEVSGSSAVNVVRVFRGEVTDAPEVTPPIIRANVRSQSPIMERKIMRRLFTPACNWTLFEGKCGLVETDWDWTGTVTGFNATTLLIGVGSLSGPITPVLANYFAGGYLKIGAGTAAQYRMIAGSTAQVGSDLSLYAATPFRTAPTLGASITFYPGCDGRYETCRDKFSNVSRFGGFPFMPIGNPSGSPVRQSESPGGKK